MKPSEQCKKAGLSGLKELSEITGQSEQTLNNWSKSKSKLFQVLITGAVNMPEDKEGKFVIHCSPKQGAEGGPSYITDDYGHTKVLASKLEAEKIRNEWEEDGGKFWEYSVKEW